MTLGIIEEGKLKGKKVILMPRTGLKDNEYLVQQGISTAGIPIFSKACLNKGCEKFIANHCDKCLSIK